MISSFAGESSSGVVESQRRARLRASCRGAEGRRVSLVSSSRICVVSACFYHLSMVSNMFSICFYHLEMAVLAGTSFEVCLDCLSRSEEDPSFRDPSHVYGSLPCSAQCPGAVQAKAQEDLSKVKDELAAMTDSEVPAVNM